MSDPKGLWERTAGFFIDSKPAVVLVLILLVGAGVSFAPFDWDLGIPRSPIAVDAIPDIGESQQIVFTEWPGRAPADVEDQVTYPLASALLGLQGVKTVRSTSMFGFSSIYVIFEDDADFYASRTRLLEKLSSLPPSLLPPDATPTLGPDATALGQVFWYSLEGRDPDGALVGGWDLHELRTLQDFTIRPALAAVPGVSEVSSIGGHVAEYQVDVDPELLVAHGVTLQQVAEAARDANVDVGARTMELSSVEYVVRGLGQLEDVRDLESAVVSAHGPTPVRIGDVATLTLGPASRRGVLDDGGAEIVGGIVVVRYGENPLAVIERVKAAIAELAPGLPERTLEDGTRSRVTIVPFYDRTQLIHETLDTLSTALVQQVLITLLVVLIMLRAFRGSVVVAVVLPLGVLFAFVGMKLFGVEANVMALGGIAIAIGSMVDVGIVFTENISAKLDEHPGATWSQRAPIVRAATAEVAPAVLTSVATTVVSFLPVFALTAADGKLFRPLAWTKTFALVGAFAVAFLVVPALAHLLLRPSAETGRALHRRAFDVLIVVVLGVALTLDWQPLGPGAGFLLNAIFVALSLAFILGAFEWFRLSYARLLRTFLAHKVAFAAIPIAVVLVGLAVWRGVPSLVEPLPEADVPPFDEGSFLYMPSTTPHASLREAKQMLQTIDAAIAQIPEVERVVGKLGRADSTLDPAPLSMFAPMVFYRSEYGVDENGERVRQWRDHIRTPDDIWDEIVAAGSHPGVSGAPVLQPISTRIVMLQTGMRGRVGIKVRGPDQDTIEAFGLRIERALRDVPQVNASSVFAERMAGKPYLELDIDRDALARYGLRVATVQQTLAMAVGGQTVSWAIDGRVRRAVRVRVMREQRDDLESLRALPVALPAGGTVPLAELAHAHYARGPQMLRAEDTFLTSFVLFDPARRVTDVEAVDAARAHLERLVRDGVLEVPDGVSWRFAGTWENQQRSSARLMILVPVALILVLIFLYLQFRSVAVSMAIFAGVAVAFGGGFALLGLWGIEPLWDHWLGDVLHAAPEPLTVGVWVGFIALLGIAVDDGVVMATYLKQRFADAPTTRDEVRDRVVEAGTRRVRACLMTTATTILALLPVLTATGRGSDVMRPMALPVVGGMLVELLTLFVVPVLWSWGWETKLRVTDARTETS